MIRRFKYLILLCISIISISSSILLACGSDFPIAMTQIRDARLLKSPLIASFGVDLKKTLTHDSTEVLRPTDKQDDAIDGLISEYWERGLSATEILNKLKDYPPSERLYATGAVAYRLDDKAQAQYYFKQVLELPFDQDNTRGVWASYMLGLYYRNIYLNLMSVARTSDGVPRLAEFYASQSHYYFDLTRRLRKQGLPDPLNLALDSYGEEARIYLHDTDFILCMPEDASDQSCYLQVSPKAFIDALTLYLEQVARVTSGTKTEDPASSINSVRRLLYAALHSDTLTQAILNNPKTQDSLILYAGYTLTPDANYSSLLDFTYAQPESTPWLEYHQQVMSTSDHKDLLTRFFRALEDIPTKNIQEIPHLATLYYSAGLYDKATELIKDQETAQIYWLKAKLALLRNDQRAATQAYTQASKSFMTIEQQNSTPRLQQTLASEQGLLALSQKEYAEALVWLIAAIGNDESNSLTRGQGIDAAYVAERVLSTDELKLFVDQRLTLPQQINDSTYGIYVRHILARRLMREQRYDEAIPYFEPHLPIPNWYTNEDAQSILNTQHEAIAYIQAYREAQQAWTGIGRSQALYQAAIIARRSGLEIMGYELFPDFAIYDGNYTDRDEGQPRSTQYMSEDEQQRIATSKSTDIPRFHYRYLAAQLAVDAAHALPTGSQAYSASLCKSYQWTRYQTPDQARIYYKDYLKHGLPLTLPGHFDKTCPEPDYDEARIRGWKNKGNAITSIWKNTKDWIRRHF